MGGGGRDSGQEREESVAVNQESQRRHSWWRNAEQVANGLGISKEEAQGYVDAIYQKGNGLEAGGFTVGWDGVIRAYENGATKADIMGMKDDDYGTIRGRVDAEWGGDANAYMNAVAKKARNCEAYISKAPKWDGGELTRGFKGLSPEVMDSLTQPGVLIDLNHGTASWSSEPLISNGFANGAPGTNLVAHCSDKRRGTSVKNLSRFNYEDEVLCSQREAFVCTRVESINGKLHAWYDLVDTNYDWRKKK